ncbi:MAG TPA: histidinol-phosphatase [Solirubrobacteraceae bacterium]|nr:histidinol-phosphatase [Solirubrobacteraceae bacterium]
MLTDYHVHLRPDGPDTPPADFFTVANAEAYRAAAAERGITELGVSEHIYRFSEALKIWDNGLWREFAHDDVDAYCAFVREETDLRLGIEADYIPGREDRVEAFLDAREWDYVVGSIHFVGDGALDHEDYDIWGMGVGVDKVWSTYFTWLGEMARTGMYDILAHPDLVKHWGGQRPMPEGDLRRFYDLAMDGIAESGIAIEVSTAGLRKPVGELYPDRAFLEMCLDAGCPVALSSDAHHAEHLGYGYDTALALLADAGVTELAVFEGRERRLQPIGPS